MVPVHFLMAVFDRLKNKILAKATTTGQRCTSPLPIQCMIKKNLYLLTSSIKCIFNVSINLYPPIALVCSDAIIDTKPEFTYKIVASQLIPPSLYTKIYLEIKTDNENDFN